QLPHPSSPVSVPRSQLPDPSSQIPRSQIPDPRSHVGVLGGGALGLAAALRLAEAGRRVTLIEREPQLGGLAAGFRVGPNHLEKFYHHIFRTDTTIIAFIRELGLDKRLIWGQPNTSTLSQGRIVSLGSIADLVRLPLL